MRHFFKTLIIVVFSVSLFSFTWLNNQNSLSSNSKSEKTTLFSNSAIDSIIITYDRSDICGLNFLGSIKITEKWLFYNNNGIKEQTQKELKKQASEKGGNIVFIDIKEKSGFGIFFTTTIEGYIYEKKK